MFSVFLDGVLDGETGCGKTMSLCHVLHFCSTQGWLVLHIPDGKELMQSVNWWGGGGYEISRHPVFFYLLVAECLQGECSTWYFSPLYFSRFSLVANTCSVKHYMYILKIANIVNICSLPFLVSLYTVAHLWVKNCSELLPSSSRPGRFDQPIQASQWLKNFKITNDHFLTKVMGNN